MRCFSIRSVLVALTALALAACGGDKAAAVAPAGAAPAGVVDSIVPVEEALRRFRADLSDPGVLDGRFSNRDSLVDAFGRALFRADTAALAELLLDRAEFAYLYYPDSHFAREPYELDPAILWFQIQNGTSKGITRALRLFGDKGYRYLGYRCEPQPRVQGGNRLWEHCLVWYRDPSGERLSGKLFGSVLERDGRFRFVSYANPL